MNIDLSTLPIDVLKKIPISIKAFKNIYNVEELPPTVRKVIEHYLKNDREIHYDKVFDMKPKVGGYGDFTTITNMEDLILEYLKNYFLTSPDEYPFDCTYGCRLKQYLHTKDTLLRQNLITAEARNLASVISSDLKNNIEIDDIKIDSGSYGVDGMVTYNIAINVKLNNRVKQISFTSIN